MLTSMGPADRECWRQNGYVVLRDRISDAEAAALLSSTEEIQSWPESPGEWMKYFESDDGSPDGRRLCRVENFLPFHRGLSDFLGSPELMELLAALFAEPAVLYKEKINFKLPGGAGFGAHQDAPAFATFGQDFHITVMVPIDDMTRENGCLEVVDRKHREGILPQDADGTLESAWVAAQDWISVPMTPRDLIIFDSYVPHRSAPNATTGPRRALYVTYNAASQGDHRADYYARKREVFPPECEREAGGELPAGAGAFNLGNPIR